MQIQLFQTSNLKTSLDLYLSVFSGPPWLDKWPSPAHANSYLEDIIATPGFLGISAFEGDNQIGLLMGNIRKWCAGDEFWIVEFCVDTNFQGKGIGTLIVSLLQTELTIRNISRIALLTVRGTRAVTFYEKNGFTFNQVMGLMTLRF